MGILNELVGLIISRNTTYSDSSLLAKYVNNGNKIMDKIIDFVKQHQTIFTNDNIENIISIIIICNDDEITEYEINEEYVTYHAIIANYFGTIKKSSGKELGEYIKKIQKTNEYYYMTLFFKNTISYMLKCNVLIDTLYSMKFITDNIAILNILTNNVTFNDIRLSNKNPQKHSQNLLYDEDIYVDNKELKIILYSKIWTNR